MVQFVEIEAEKIISEMVAEYESATGRILYPGQVERLLINAFAYRETLIRTQINSAANQNLVAFSTAPYLDFLGEIVGVKRKTASSAVCKVQFTLVEGHGLLTLPAGLRVQSIDGTIVFSLDSNIEVASDVNTVIGQMTCLVEGRSGNSLAIGAVNAILDPQPYLLSASNTEVTAGGADIESDEDLRQRIILAPQAFSNAGSRGAYEYHAKSASPSIAHVSISSPEPGQVNIYPLLQDGEIPNSEIIDAVKDACNSERVRPLTDTVVVEAPDIIDYDISVSLTLVTGAVSADVIESVTSAIQSYADQRKQRCGQDIVRERIIQICMQNSAVYSVTVSAPAATIVVDLHEVAKMGDLTVTSGGYSDE